MRAWYPRVEAGGACALESTAEISGTRCRFSNMAAKVLEGHWLIWDVTKKREVMMASWDVLAAATFMMVLSVRRRGPTRAVQVLSSLFRGGASASMFAQPGTSGTIAMEVMGCLCLLQQPFKGTAVTLQCFLSEVDICGDHVYIYNGCRDGQEVVLGIIYNGQIHPFCPSVSHADAHAQVQESCLLSHDDDAETMTSSGKACFASTNTGAERDHGSGIQERRTGWMIGSRMAEGGRNDGERKAEGGSNDGKRKEED